MGNVGNYLPPGQSGRTSVRILTVDPANRRVEGVLKDGSQAQIAVWDDAGNAFRWPVENEIWIVRRDNGMWVLDSRVQSGEITSPSVTNPEPFPITTMSPGELKLDGQVVRDANGYTFVAVDLTGIQNGWTLRWSSTLNRFVAGA